MVCQEWAGRVSPRLRKTRWGRGEFQSDIGRALGKFPASIFGVLRLHGGIRPAKRVGAARALSSTDREEISRGLASGRSIRNIADCIGRAPSTVSREIARNGGRRRYRAPQADIRAWDRARRPKPCQLAQNASLRRIVVDKLAEDWSPEQIAGWLRLSYPDDVAMQVSHETIYRCLYIQTRGVLKKELQKHLRTQRVFHQSRHGNLGRMRSSIKDAIPISQRPPEVDDRAVPGHWEGDLLSGSGNTHIATLVERSSRFTMLVKVEGKDTRSVIDGLSRQIVTLPESLRRSLTWDRGSELADHKRLTLATDMAIYFCDPSSPWQRGTNENTNRLLRQYFPKKTNLGLYSQEQLDPYSSKLNQRPRKTLGYLTPAESFDQSVALTH
ncbi:IS30 family transposase [Salinisphaera aquimarina]|uniref:IS30 family transposase n=1 Tax=Salinisphaera aquimarina TaxID=2094031 RepID=A0ABV7ENP6_9GAMM